MGYDVVDFAAGSAEAQDERLRARVAHDRFMVAKRRAAVKWRAASEATGFLAFVSAAVEAHELEAEADSIKRTVGGRAEFWG